MFREIKHIESPRTADEIRRELINLYLDLQIKTLEARFNQENGHEPDDKELSRTIMEAASANNGELARKWRGLWDKVMVLASQDPDNAYFTGIDFNHNPNPEECLLHFLKNGGWDLLIENHPEIIQDLDLRAENLKV